MGERHSVLHDAAELLIWTVALTFYYPRLLIDDLIHRHEFDDFMAEQDARFRAMHEGE